MDKFTINEIKKEYKEYKEKRRNTSYIIKDLDSLISENSYSLNKVLIIVPFRANKSFRNTQLYNFVEYYHNFGDNIQILIIEQSYDDKKFNRGALLNIGFDLGKISNPDVYIFHDVDLISSKELIPLYYTKPSSPIHIGNLWKEKYNFRSFFGGINSFNREDFETINGFPNTFYGWGGEDDAVLNRILINKIDIVKPNSTIDSYIKDMNPEIQENDNRNIKEETEKKSKILKDLKNWKKDGLNSLQYDVLSFKEYKYPNIHRIKVKLLV